MTLRKYLLALLLTLSFSSFSQTPKTLLWKISGKGLKQPSYLFGTMHMNDKRLFMLGDSLFAAIERTNGFAMEVNPDEMAAYVINNIINDEKGSKLKEILSAETFNKYADALSKKLGKDADDITARDIVNEKNKWITEYLEKGEMPTFLDAYLYNIAKRQGKWVGGVEDMADQANLLENLVDESDIIALLSGENTTEAIRKGLDHMRKVYIAEDLDAIEQLTIGYEDRDALLIRRNIKMARRMDSLSAIRTMLFAVGAAHLPGDSGVIALLRKRGFRVDPVISSKKIDAAKYTYKEVELPWVTVHDSVSFYKVEMPSTPTDINLMGALDMKFLIDLSTTSAFCTMAFPNPGGGSNEDALMESFSKTFSKKKKMGAPRKFERNGVNVYEYLQSSPDGNTRMQLFVRNNSVYMAMMHAAKKQVVVSAEADRFFNSFAPTQQKRKTVTYSFRDQNKDVDFQTPVRMMYSKALSKNEEGSGWKVAAYMGTDINNGSYYLFIERRVEKGYYLNDFSQVLAEFKEMLPTQIEEVLEEGERKFKNGSGYFVKGYSTKEKDIVTSMLYTFRDNRIYLFSAISDGKVNFDAFFDSIEYLPYKESGWKTQTSEDNRFSTWAPAPFYRDYSDDSTSSQLVTFDENASSTMYVLTDTLSEYYWASSEAAFWKEQVNNYNSDGDSVIRVTDAKNGDAVGKDLLISRPGGSMTRIRILRDGNVLYSLSAYAQEAHLYSANIDKYFKEFRFTSPVKPYDVTVSKAKKLIDALQDSNTVRTAYYSISTANFEKKDLPLLHDALFRKFPLVYEYSASTLVNQALAEKLAKLNEKETLDFIRKEFPRLTGDKEEMKWAALYALSSFKTNESYRQMQQLLSGDARPEGYNYDFFASLRENYDLLKTIYPDLIKIIPDTTYSLYLTEYGVTMIDSNVMKKSFFVQNEAPFHQLTDLYIQRNKNNTDDEYEWKMESLIGLHERIATPASIQSLRRIMQMNILYLKREAALSLTKLKEKVDPAVFNAIAADPYFRISLYDRLKEMNRLELFPKAYATQKAIAEGEAMDAASEDGAPDTIIFVKEKTAELGGKKYKFYLFKARYEYEDGTNEYLVVAGGFDPDGKKIEVAHYYCSVYWEKEFDAAAIDALFEEWKKQYSEDDEDDD